MRINLALLPTSLVLQCLAASGLGAQALGPSRTGPLIAEFGAVYAVQDPDFVTDTETTYRIVFEVKDGSEDPGTVNRRIETLATARRARMPWTMWDTGRDSVSRIPMHRCWRH
jgi:hypothetical protein